jgi:hypothetical protein
MKPKEYLEYNGKYYLKTNVKKIGNTYTGFITWGSGENADEEEIDVVAKNDREVSKLIKLVLNAEYQKGGRIKRLMKRYGYYF